MNIEGPDWSKFGLPFIAGLLLLVASVKLWRAPDGELFAATLLGASLVLIGISVHDWTHRK